MPAARKPTTRTRREAPAAKPVPSPPANLDAYGRALWRQVFHGAAKGWITETDYPLVRMLCMAWADIHEYRRIISLPAKEGGGRTRLEPIVSPSGRVVGARVVAHPLIRELRAAEKSFEGTAALLGLTMSSRDDLGIRSQKADTLDELARRRAARIAGSPNSQG